MTFAGGTLASDGEVGGADIWPATTARSISSTHRTSASLGGSAAALSDTSPATRPRRSRLERRAHSENNPIDREVTYTYTDARMSVASATTTALPPDHVRTGHGETLRKNYLFVDHPRAGRNIAAAYSLVGCCIANRVEPTEYLTDVLPRIARAWSDSDLDALVPDRWRASGPAL